MCQGSGLHLEDVVSHLPSADACLSTADAYGFGNHFAIAIAVSMGAVHLGDHTILPRS